MNITAVENKNIIEKHFRKNTDLNIYSIGDLDDFFWNYTKWFAIGPENNPEEIVLLYEGAALPTFLAITENKNNSMLMLIDKIMDKLPENLYCHLSKGLIKAFDGCKEINEHGNHFKMSLKNKKMLLSDCVENIRRLNSGDIEKINNLYSESYPDNFFDKRMLDTGKYFGYYDNDKLAGIAGVHVYSEKYKVASLGNITISPSFRGKSLCKKLTSAICINLLQNVDNIGLNVHTENLSAINCYKKTGFEIIAEYEEYHIKRN